MSDANQLPEKFTEQLSDDFDALETDVLAAMERFVDTRGKNGIVDGGILLAVLSKCLCSVAIEAGLGKAQFVRSMGYTFDAVKQGLDETPDVTH